MVDFDILQSALCICMLTIQISWFGRLSIAFSDAIWCVSVKRLKHAFLEKWHSQYLFCQSGLSQTGPRGWRWHRGRCRGYHRGRDFYKRQLYERQKKMKRNDFMQARWLHSRSSLQAEQELHANGGRYKIWIWIINSSSIKLKARI